jgi:hypothetical protein
LFIVHETPYIVETSEDTELKETTGWDRASLLLDTGTIFKLRILTSHIASLQAMIV